LLEVSLVTSNAYSAREIKLKP